MRCRDCQANNHPPLSLKRQIHDSSEAIRISDEPLQLSCMSPYPLPMVKVYIWLFRSGDFTHARIEFHPLAEVSTGARRVEQPIDLVVAVATVVELRLAGQHVIDIHVGIGEAWPAHQQRLVIALLASLNRTHSLKR